MKKMTFAVWFTALLAVFTFSSCLDSDGTNTQLIWGYVKVDGFIGNMSFSDPSGHKYNPANQGQLKLTETPEYAWISGNFTEDGQTQNTKTLDIVLTSFLPSYSKYMFGSVSEVPEGYSNAPIRLISNGSATGVPVGFWDKYTMFLPIEYYVEQTEDSKQGAELNQHSFDVFYDLDRTIENINLQANDDDLVLYVKHHVADASRNAERKARSITLYHLNIRNALNAFSEKFSGATPERIFICYDLNGYDGNDKTAIPNGGVCEIKYAEIVKELDKMNKN